MLVVTLYSNQNSPTLQLREFGIWSHLFDAAEPELWSKYILSNMSVLCILCTHFKSNFVLIANMQIISNKVDTASVYLVTYIYRKLYLVLRTKL